MAATFGFYQDLALTQAFTALSLLQSDDGAVTPADVQIWFGSTATGKQVQAQSDPGVDPIGLSVADSNPGGGQPSTACRLATTQVGLDSATPGAALNLGPTILSSPANAFTFWLRVRDQTGVVGNYTDLSLAFNTLIETYV